MATDTNVSLKTADNTIRPVERNMDNLHQRLVNLDSALMALFQKLNPALGPEGPDNTTVDPNVREEVSPLAGWIIQMTDHVASMERMVIHVSERVEL